MKKICNIFLGLILAAIFLINLKWGNNDHLVSYDGIELDYVKATVVDIVDETLDYPYNSKPVGIQNIKAKIKNTGEIVDVENKLEASHSVLVKENDKVILAKSRNPHHNSETFYRMYNYDRSFGTIFWIVLFLVFIALVAGSRGIKSTVALVISIYIILFFDISLIMNGFNNVLITILTVILCTIFSTLILYGYSKMSLINMISVSVSFIFVSILVKLMSIGLNISGYNLENVGELILVIGKEWKLNIENLLFSTVAISALGASMDVSVSIASALREIQSLNKDVSSKKLFKSGMSIGKDIIGTMVNTLVFAFIGSSLVSIIIFILHGTNTFNRVVSSDFFAVEITKALIGISVVIIMVPVTSFFASKIYKADSFYKHIKWCAFFNVFLTNFYILLTLKNINLIF